MFDEGAKLPERKKIPDFQEKNNIIYRKSEIVMYALLSQMAHPSPSEIRQYLLE